MSFISINLNIFERKFLVYLSQNGGCQDLSNDSISNEVQNALDRLTQKGALTKTRIVGKSNTNQYKLTSIGNNLVDLIKENGND